MSFLEFLLLKYSSTMHVCPLMTANIRGVKPDVVGSVKSFRPCNKVVSASCILLFTFVS